MQTGQCVPEFGYMLTLMVTIVIQVQCCEVKLFSGTDNVPSSFFLSVHGREVCTAHFDA